MRRRLAPSLRVPAAVSLTSTSATIRWITAQPSSRSTTAPRPAIFTARAAPDSRPPATTSGKTGPCTTAWSSCPSSYAIAPRARGASYVRVLPAAQPVPSLADSKSACCATGGGAGHSKRRQFLDLIALAISLTATVAIQHKGNVRMPNKMRNPGAPTPMSEQLVRQAVCKAGDGEYTAVGLGCVTVAALTDVHVAANSRHLHRRYAALENLPQPLPMVCARVCPRCALR